MAHLTLATAASSITISGGGKLVLASDASTTGRLAQMTSGATITGNLTQERYLPSTGWHLVTAPFSAATTIADFDEVGVRVSPKNNATIFANVETTLATDTGRYNGAIVETNGWKVPASLGSPVNPGNTPTGYRLYTAPGATAHVFATSGSPLTGNQTAPFTKTPAGYSGRRLELACQSVPV